MSRHQTLRPATRAARAGLERDTQHGAVVPPIHLSSTFTFAGFDDKRRYDYTRSGNPTRDLLAEALAEAEGGAGAIVTASGMAAITVMLHLLDPGALVLAPRDCYGGTWRLLDALTRRGALRARFIDPTDPEDLGRWLGPRSAEPPAMVWIETPSNPLLRITDLAAVAALARGAGALLVADNTFLSPALQQPLALGADLVVHSTTKYLNGHSDVVGGAVVARDPALVERLGWWANCLGLTGAPFDAFMTLRGLRTLHSRIRVHEENACALARRLERDPAVSRVYHPSLPDHPGHAVAAAQQQGFGAMVSFELRGGVAAVRAFLDGLRCFSLAESLGGVESLVAHPATMTHAAMSAEARARAGIGGGLLRLSVGIEALEDLETDIADALARAHRIDPAAVPLREVACHG